MVAASWLGTWGVCLRADAGEVNLLEKYPTSLTVGDADPYRAREWAFTDSDVFQLSTLSFQVGAGLQVKIGLADLGIGHCIDGAVWAVVIPRVSGTLTSEVTSEPEPISHLWLRFHPKVINQLFPPTTVLGEGDRSLTAQMSVIANHKIRSSWQAGGKAMIPEPKDMTVDADTVGGAAPGRLKPSGSNEARIWLPGRIGRR